MLDQHGVVMEVVSVGDLFDFDGDVLGGERPGVVVEEGIELVDSLLLAFLLGGHSESRSGGCSV